MDRDEYTLGFAEYLKQYIQRKKLTWKKASELSNVDRSLLMRYARGEKIPREKDRVIQIAKGLQMNDEEVAKLLELHECEKIGLQQYMVNRYLEQKTKESMQQVRKEFLGNYGKNEFVPQEGCLRNKADICRVFSQMLRSGEDIKLMTAGGEDILTFISEDHSVRLGKIHVILEQNFQNPNWKELQKIDQMIAFLLKWEQRVLESVNVSEKIHTSQNKVEVCIINHAVLVFDSGLSRGFYSTEQKQILFYQTIFEKQSGNGSIIGSGIAVEKIKLVPELQLKSETHIYQLIEADKNSGSYKIGVINREEQRAFLIENPSVVHWFRAYIDKRE